MPAATHRTDHDRAWRSLVALLVLALLLRAWTFGDPNLHDDELFYFYVGQRMQDGVLPYVGIWDRKPPGLFLLYGAIAGISRAVIAYQLAATLAAALTAWLIARMAGRMGAGHAGIAAGALYLAALPLLGGWGGQAAVFMNLLTAAAGWALISSDAAGLGRRALAATAAAGIAITLKQTAVVEALFFAAWALARMAAQGAGARRLALAALGFAALIAAPMLAWAAFYAAVGHFGAFWHAMVLANLHKAYNPSHDLLRRWLAVAALLAPIALMALAGRADRATAAPRRFCLGWLVAALAGAALVPNLLDHYALPVLVALCALTGPFLSRGRLALAVALVVTAGIAAETRAPDWNRASRSRAAMADLVSQIRARDPHPALLVYDGPVYLYALLDAPPPSPLMLPFHLDYAPERDTSPWNTATEFRRILATRPSVIVTQPRAGASDLMNRETLAMVDSYIAARCRWSFRHALLDAYGNAEVEVHGGCANPWGDRNRRSSAPPPR